jgi:hypothetical protein
MLAVRNQMNEPDNPSPKRKYQWPWMVAVAIFVFLALAVFWVSLAVKKVEQQRDFGPLPASTPAR